MYESQKSHYPCLKCPENEEKIDNDRVLRNVHRIKTTYNQPILMILVSFFSKDSVLERSAFFWDTRYNSYLIVIYRVSQKKRNGGCLVHYELKVLHMFISLEHLPQKRMIPRSLNLDE